MKDILKCLGEKTVIFDGAMGTELYKRNFFVNVSYENLCLSSPKVIREIHNAYKEAGAEVLTTNSYGANFANLSKFALGDKVVEINRASVAIAREVAGDELMVAGSVGPVEIADDEEAVKMLEVQVQALIAGGADFIIFETLGAVRDVARVLNVIDRIDDFPYILSCTFSPDGTLKDGTAAQDIFDKIAAAANAPAAFGMNCGLGPDEMLNVMEKIIKLSPYHLVVQPNAGLPKNVGGRTIAMCSPEYFTTYAMRYMALGAKGIGGCCGTNPDDIRDMARSINPLNKKNTNSSILDNVNSNAGVEAPEFSSRSAFAAKLAAGKWVCNIELVPPGGFQMEETIAKAVKCREAGFDAINIPDGPRASSRISAIAAAAIIQSKAGIEAILHQCCRDKNLIGMQSDLLGCAALGIRNILFITGDPPKLGDYPFASGVFDIDSIGLIKIQNRLNHALDMIGKSLPSPCSAVIGAGADPNAIDMEREVRRTREKIQAGAEYIVTQPVFEPDALLRFIERVPELEKIPVIGGIWPLASLRNAEFMKNEVPGVTVPDSVIERMGRYSTREEQLNVGIEIARESIQKIRHSVAGVQISAPFGKVEIAMRVIE